MDYETILTVLAEKIKDQQTTIYIKDYQIKELEKKVNTYEAQIESQIKE